VEYVSVKQSSGSGGEKLVTITTKTNHGEEQLLFPTIFIRNKNWALKSSRAYVIDDSGKKPYTDYTRTYSGELDGFPLLKQVSNLTFASDDGQLSWDETFLISRIDLSPPPLSIFDPKQFISDNTTITVQQTTMSVERIILIIIGIVLILLGILLKLKSKN
jgi:hypothetical protein